jgi:hypothetical protein
MVSISTFLHVHIESVVILEKIVNMYFYFSPVPASSQFFLPGDKTALMGVIFGEFLGPGKNAPVTRKRGYNDVFLRGKEKKGAPTPGGSAFGETENSRDFAAGICIAMEAREFSKTFANKCDQSEIKLILRIIYSRLISTPDHR